MVIAIFRSKTAKFICPNNITMYINPFYRRKCNILGYILIFVSKSVWGTKIRPKIRYYDTVTLHLSIVSDTKACPSNYYALETHYRCIICYL